MRKILFLMVPLNFSGSIYSKAATAICLPVIGACFGASIWSNRHGVDVLFSSLPPFALEALKVAVCFIDPLAWMAFVLLVVSAIVFQKLEKEQDRVELKGLDIKAYKRRALLAATIFFSVTACLTWLSYNLSEAGGKRGAGAYVDEKHAPVPLAGIVDKRMQALASEKKALAGTYQDALAEAISARAAAEKAQKESAGWDKNGEPNWKQYNANMAAKTAKAKEQAKIEGIREAIAIKEGMAEKAHQTALDAEKQAHGQQSAKHMKIATETEAAMGVAVSLWTVAGLLAQAMACALTFGQYEATAYALLVYEMNERAGNAKKIDKQMLALSAGNETGTGASTRAGTRALAYRRLHRQVAELSEAKEAHGHTQISIPEIQAESEPVHHAPVQQEQQPAAYVQAEPPSTHMQPETSTQAIVRALDGQGFKLAWVRQWRVALADPGLMPKPINPQGMSKEEIAEKYGCGSSQVDNLRRCRRIITAFAGSEQAFLDAIENV